MANTKFDYVKGFEENESLLKNTYLVVRIDGRGFTKFTNAHDFKKPNDIRGMHLMNEAALSVMKSFTDIFISYGQSDEYSFVFKRSARTFNRRKEKILTCKTPILDRSRRCVFVYKCLSGELGQVLPRNRAEA